MWNGYCSSLTVIFKRLSSPTPWHLYHPLINITWLKMALSKVVDTNHDPTGRHTPMYFEESPIPLELTIQFLQDVFTRICNSRGHALRFVSYIFMPCVLFHVMFHYKELINLWRQRWHLSFSFRAVLQGRYPCYWLVRDYSCCFVLVRLNMAHIYIKLFTGVRVAIAAEHIWSKHGN